MRRHVGRFAGLSPRRRAMLVAVALAATLGAALVLRLAVAPDAAPAAGADPPPQDRPGPVLLVPGYGGGTRSLERLAELVRGTGRDARVIEPVGDGTGDLVAQADALDRAVATALDGDDAPSVDLVGYSAGGVVVRLWVQRHGGTAKARRIVTLGSPHHGADLAAAGAAAVPGACPAACQQLAPGSRLLAELDTPVPVPPAWLSVWTQFDETVTPPESASLEGATNVRVQDVCPDAVTRHGDLPTDPTVVGLVLGALGQRPIQATPTTRC